MCFMLTGWDYPRWYRLTMFNRVAITHHQSPSSRQFLVEDGVYDANSAQSTVDDSISWYDIDGAGERHIHTQIYIYIYYLYVYLYIYLFMYISSIWWNQLHLRWLSHCFESLWRRIRLAGIYVRHILKAHFLPHASNDKSHWLTAAENI